ncbi:MAG: ThuA domain-containing protein [Clostridiales bacterium]|nr:ThuA domain-containing protein [Clostridiales bacterium]
MANILVLCGDIWHPAEVIRAGFSCLEEFYPHMTFVEDAKDMLTAADLAAYDLVICCKGNHLTAGNSVPWFEENVNECTPAHLRSYVEGGGGFLAVHAGCSFSEGSMPENCLAPCREYIDLVGCRFVTHPPRCPVTYRVVDAGHPVTAGVESFCRRDEHYQIQLTAPDARILMESDSASAATMPAAYVRSIGSGRLCALIPGHILAVWQDAQFQRLLTNAIRWCMRKQED